MAEEGFFVVSVRAKSIFLSLGDAPSRFSGHG